MKETLKRNWKGITASKCALFTNIDTAYIPIGRIVRTGGIAACLAYYDKLGPEFSEQIRRLLRSSWPHRTPPKW